MKGQTGITLTQAVAVYLSSSEKEVPTDFQQHQTLFKVARGIFKELGRQVARDLSRESKPGGNDTGISIELLACLLGTTREIVIRAVFVLQGTGYIKLEGKICRLEGTGADMIAYRLQLD